MRVLMLGWEFPPYLTGGLGTACYGLTRALDQRKHHITFLLPRPVEQLDDEEHVQILAPPAPRKTTVSPWQPNPNPQPTAPVDWPQTTFYAAPSRIWSPYTQAPPDPWVFQPPATTPFSAPGQDPTAPALTHVPSYQADPSVEAHRYAEHAIELAEQLIENQGGGAFDLIHAHDWMTFPAAQAVAQRTGKPWVAHIHATEFDRAGGQPDPTITTLEQQGVQQADHVIAVSRFTRTVLVQRHHVPAERITVVYNGTPPEHDEEAPKLPTDRERPTVLFLGRLTPQKGPSYFLAAARRVLDKLPRTRFIMAGTGELAADLVQQVARLDLGRNVFFAGFLQGRDVDHAFQLADVYVMPSVSEPFGLAALEAARNDVPVILSKQAGVGEVVHGTLKADFWNVDAMAEKIIAVLTRPALANALKQRAHTEMGQLTWETAAARCEAVYQQLVQPTPLPSA